MKYRNQYSRRCVSARVPSQIVIVFLTLFLLSSCRQNTENTPQISSIPAVKNCGDLATLELEVVLNPEAYGRSRSGEPPQLALWIEALDGSTMRTLLVTHRMAQGKWLGKVECASCLPFWLDRYQRINDSPPPDFQHPLPDAISAATPGKRVTVSTEIPMGSEWSVFLEINAGGDFNPSFPDTDYQGRPDPEGNGQPSLVYRAHLHSRPGSEIPLVLLGHMGQRPGDKELNIDLTGITSAAEMVLTAQVSIR